MADEGLSGYKGHNVERGSLGHFLIEVKAGNIPAGTALIIENHDRLSRQGIDETTDLLKQLTQNGIEVHVIKLNQVLKAGFNRNITDYIIIGVQADLAYQESQKKSERVQSAKDANKEKAKDGYLYTSNLPAWLAVQDGKIVEATEENISNFKDNKRHHVPASVVKEVFSLAAQGVGSDNITRQPPITVSASVFPSNFGGWRCVKT